MGVILFLFFRILSPFLWGLIIVVVSMIPLIGVGPLLATLCIVIWQQFGNRYRDELSTKSSPTTNPSPVAPAE